MALVNAKDTPLSANPGTLPNVSEGLLNWFQKMTFKKITKALLNFSIIEVATAFDTLGVRQPMKPQDLAMKPEGQRQWQWETMHTIPNVILVPDDVIEFSSIRYRVMSKTDWKEYGYIEYTIVRDFLPPDYLTAQDGSNLATQGDGRTVG